MYLDYFEALLWANDLDIYSIEDIDKESLKKQIKQCDDFFKLAQSILDDTDYTQEQAEHDFFFTRCRYGVGFWENDFCNEKQGQRLTEIAEKFSNIYVYTDNNTVYIE